jgi:hydroxymethylglutaryl-CoA reductase (NADPH)
LRPRGVGPTFLGMPMSRDQAREILRRLTRHGSVDDLAKRLEPVSPAERPLPHDVPHPSDATATGRDRRLAYLAEQGFEVPHLAGRAPQPDPAEMAGNIENFIGMAQVPVGLAGPLRVNGVHARGDYLVPLATTEATLVASYHRGARLVSHAGGASALVTTEHVQRAPGFVFERMVDAARFAAWAIDRFDRFVERTREKSRHAKLLDVATHIEANHVYLIFSFHTGDAAGQNMVTLCTEAICEEILATTPVTPRSWYLESNMSGDKKATVLSFLQTRGRRAMAEALLPRKLVVRGLGTTPERMDEYWRLSFVGGAQTGSIGVSGHVANGLAALFLACGQDVACVSEASVGITRLERTESGDLYCSVTLPNLIVGTVGGGTRMPTARECLRILRCDGAGDGREIGSKFAEIVAAVLLAGEISIVGAICANEFAGAHERLRRPVDPA